MESLTNYKGRLRMSCSSMFLNSKSLVLIALVLIISHAAVQAQDVQYKYTRPSWWFGAAAGANLNFYRGSTQMMNESVMAPIAFHKGFGAGLYVAPLVEFHRPETRLGFMLQLGYDSRKGKFEEMFSPCNCPRNLSTKLSYITLEPSLRIAPFRGNFYVYVGPRLAYNVSKSFTYKEGTNPAYPEQVAEPDVEADFSDMKKVILSMQVGLGYDIQLSSKNKKTQWVLSPFISYHPYFGQSPRTVETWNVSTLRVGAAIKFGRGKKVDSNEKSEAVTSNDNTKFSVYSPKNIPAERRVRESFPLRNYVFFDLGSTEIPDRYVLLRKEQVKDFKEDQLEAFPSKRLSGRSNRQMVVYYNVLNIVGDRMGKNPSSTIKLVGSSEKGPEDGKLMAESVKKYLVDVFAIDGSRIATEGRDKPKLPSEQPNSSVDLDLLREGDRRVSIESGTPAMLMEFQNGPTAPLKPVEIVATQTAPFDSYVSFTAEGAKANYSSWSLELKDDKGTVQRFGPYTQDNVRISGKSILGTKPEGDYKVTMIGKTKDGKTVKKETSTRIVLWTPPHNEEAMRFSIIYEFDDAKAINIYEKYLSEVVTPKIPKGGTVIIHGYTDVIGSEEYNHNLSHARANDVKKIMENSLAKAGRSDVKFEVYGFGEDENMSPFENKFPEERFYNRTVIIDIVIGK
jgi:outer membrane protein OmpA-like peptidoglycan-associated protein